MTTSEFQVSGMTCGHCERAVRETVGKVSGVEQLEVSAKAGRLVLSSATALNEAEVIAAVREAGFEATAVR